MKFWWGSIDYAYMYSSNILSLIIICYFHSSYTTDFAMLTWQKAPPQFTRYLFAQIFEKKTFGVSRNLLKFCMNRKFPRCIRRFYYILSFVLLKLTLFHGVKFLENRCVVRYLWHLVSYYYIIFIFYPNFSLSPLSKIFPFIW